MFIPDVGAPPFQSKTHDICVTFRTLGAVSPETAVARETLANIDGDALEAVAIIAFWLALLAIPLLLINFLS